MRRARRAVNRVLLGLIGLVLLGTGGLVLMAGLDLPRRWGFGLPGGWPWTRPDQVPLSDERRTRWTDSGWWWPVVIAVLAVLFLLSLWWLLAQLRRRRVSHVLVDSGDGEGVRVRGRALEGVLTAETQALEGVSRAGVQLTGRRGAPLVRAALALAPHAEPGAVLSRLSDETLAHARESTGLERLPAEARLRAVRHRPERVS